MTSVHSVLWHRLMVVQCGPALNNMHVVPYLSVIPIAWLLLPLPAGQPKLRTHDFVLPPGTRNTMLYVPNIYSLVHDCPRASFLCVQRPERDTRFSRGFLDRLSCPEGGKERCACQEHVHHRLHGYRVVLQSRSIPCTTSSSSLVDNTHLLTHLVIDKVHTTLIYWHGRLRIVSILGLMLMDLHRQVTHCRVSTNTDCLLAVIARTCFAMFSLSKPPTPIDPPANLATQVDIRPGPPLDFARRMILRTPFGVRCHARAFCHPISLRCQMVQYRAVQTEFAYIRKLERRGNGCQDYFNGARISREGRAGPRKWYGPYGCKFLGRKLWRYAYDSIVGIQSQPVKSLFNHAVERCDWHMFTVSV
jgi:hypothetical protein